MADTLSLVSNPFVTNLILPLLLVFVVVFAILEKTNLLGENKKAANLIVAIVIALLFVGVQSVVGFTVRLLPLVAVFLVVLLGYFLVFGFIGVHEAKGLKITLGIVFGIAFIAAVFWATGILNKFVGKPSAEIIGIVVFLAILGGAIALVVSVPTKK